MEENGQQKEERKTERQVETGSARRAKEVKITNQKEIAKYKSFGCFRGNFGICPRLIYPPLEKLISHFILDHGIIIFQQQHFL